eukprot:g2028.t1
MMHKSYSIIVVIAAAALASANETVPMEHKEIAPGVNIPMVGIGTWLYNASTAKNAVSTALSVGYTHIDTAYDYGNAEGVGEAIAESKIDRKRLFVTTKVEGGLNRSRTFEEHADNLKKLQLDYVDLLLVHFPCLISPEGDLSGSKAMRQEQWKAMEELHEQKKARAIGISHYCRRHLDDILEIARIKPAINQVEFHIGMGSAGPNATDDREYLESKGITFQSFSPLCGPCCMGDTTGKCTFNKELITGDLVTSIGAKYNKTGAQVSLRWQVQQGIPVIPKTDTVSHLKENIDLFGWELSSDDMDALTSATTPPVSGGGDGLTSGDCSMP